VRRLIGGVVLLALRCLRMRLLLLLMLLLLVHDAGRPRIMRLLNVLRLL